MADDTASRALSKLPLRPSQLAVMASLANGPAAGIAMLDHAERLGAGSAVLGPGTLYRLLRELSAEGLIDRSPAPSSLDPNGDQRANGDRLNDERRQYYALTALGRAVLEAEAARLRRTLADAGLLPAGPGS